MQTASIYKIHKKGYLIFGSVKTVSGFRVGVDPYIQIPESDANSNTIADAIKKVLETDDTMRVADPKNWKEFDNLFLQKTGLKSLKELNKPATLCCSVKKENNIIFFTPTKHAEKPDQGFVNKSKEESNIEVAYSDSNQAITEAFELALSRCE